MTRLLDEVLASLPPAWPEPMLPRIRGNIESSGRVVVVLDDDPTGTQTVHDVPVLTEWTAQAIEREFAGGASLFYILTNSRSLAQSEAERLAREIGRNLATASAKAQRPFTVISRSDSTLRGHYPAELDALAESLDLGDAVRMIIPFFEEGGRYTIDNVHYVAEAGQLIPAAQTPFARDSSFGYTRSNLREWVEEKTGGRMRASAVRAIDLDTIRRGGPAVVKERLLDLPPSTTCVVNAAAMRDLEVVAMAILSAEAEGKRFLFRTAASFVRARAGQAAHPLLKAADLGPGPGKAGLIVVGSHVPKTTQQLDNLLRRPGLAPVSIDVSLLLDDKPRDGQIARATSAIHQHLAAGRHVVLFTSRAVIRGSDPADSLRIGKRVSEAVVRVVAGLGTPPRFLVAKGGITSSDLATQALGVKRAMVRGQILPGVPVWRLGSESRYPGMNYIIFPGNVGGPDALAEVYARLTSTA